MKPYVKVALPIQSRKEKDWAFTIAFAFGGWGGFKAYLKNGAIIKRIGLGFLAVIFIKRDLEYVLPGLTDYIESLERQVNELKIQTRR